MFKIDIQDNKSQCEINIVYSIKFESDISIPLRTLTKESLEKEIDMAKGRLLELVVKEAINEKGLLDV
jgi:hypothetical protein